MGGKHILIVNGMHSILILIVINIQNDLRSTDKTTYMIQMCKYRCPSMFDLEMYHGAAGWGVWCWTMIGLGFVDKTLAYNTLKNSAMLNDAKEY